MNSGGTLFPICRIPSSNSPANLKASGNDPKRLNSGSEKRLRSDPVHCAVHAEVPVIPANRPRRFAGIKLHAVESGSRDVLLRSIDPDLGPILEGPVPQASVEQFRKLVLRSRDAFQRIAASDRLG